MDRQIVMMRRLILPLIVMKTFMAACLTLDGSGAVYVAGRFTNLDNRGQIAMVKLNSAGESLWTYIYPHQPISPWTDATRD